MGEGVDVAYYLVHAMAGGAGFEQRERVAAANFARMAKREGVGRVVYLGGLGSTLRYLAERLPVMVAPSWLRTRTGRPLLRGHA